jgi:hypothetical protein
MRVARTYRIPESTDLRIKELARARNESEADVIAAGVEKLSLVPAKVERDAGPIAKAKRSGERAAVKPPESGAPINPPISVLRVPILRPSGKL